MGKALIIGAGGVAGVVIHKCCQNSEVFTEICIASRTKSKCDKFKEELQDKTATKITTAQVDANDVDQLIALIEQEKPDICWQTKHMAHISISGRISPVPLWLPVQIWHRSAFTRPAAV